MFDHFVMAHSITNDVSVFKPVLSDINMATPDFFW